MATYRILHGFHREGGVLYAAARGLVGRPAGQSGRELADPPELITTSKNLLLLNTASDGHPSVNPKFELVTP